MNKKNRETNKNFVQRSNKKNVFFLKKNQNFVRRRPDLEDNWILGAFITQIHCKIVGFFIHKLPLRIRTTKSVSKVHRLDGISQLKRGEKSTSFTSWAASHLGCKLIELKNKLRLFEHMNLDDKS